MNTVFSEVGDCDFFGFSSSFSCSLRRISLLIDDRRIFSVGLSIQITSVLKKKVTHHTHNPSFFSSEGRKLYGIKRFRFVVSENLVMLMKILKMFDFQK